MSALNFDEKSFWLCAHLGVLGEMQRTDSAASSDSFPFSTRENTVVVH